MKTSMLLKLLTENETSLHIMLPSGEFVPDHFHITEVGRVTKKFIDCGGTKRQSITCLLQVWVAHDTDHRLTTTKLAQILKVADSHFGLEELSVEIEYENEVISQHPLGDVEVTPKGLLFVLGNKHTECLAPDKCGVGSGCC